MSLYLSPRCLTRTPGCSSAGCLLVPRRRGSCHQEGTSLEWDSFSQLCGREDTLALEIISCGGIKMDAHCALIQIDSPLVSIASGAAVSGDHVT